MLESYGENNKGLENTVVDNEGSTDSFRTGYITGKESFSENIGKIVDLTLYEDIYVVGSVRDCRNGEVD